MKVGDKCRILVDEPNWTNLKNGDVVKLISYVPDGTVGGKPGPYWSVRSRSDVVWYVEPQHMEVLVEPSMVGVSTKVTEKVVREEEQTFHIWLTRDQAARLRDVLDGSYENWFTSPPNNLARSLSKALTEALS